MRYTFMGRRGRLPLDACKGIDRKSSPPRTTQTRFATGSIVGRARTFDAP
jgi:hypothetical protein